MPNRLSSARSPYLREAAHQPVDWSPWDEEAFARAKKEGKPVLLDIGAVWCHWCHVMDHESYEDPATARIVNELFVAVKVDRDERPDVDARYQKAVSAITGQGGWPLTAFLTPEGEVFFGGTYFPPKDAHGRPGFPRLLREVSRFFHERPDDVREQARRIREAIAPRSMRAEGALPRRAIESVRDAAYTHFDPVHGGFGTAPKFPHTSTVDLLLRRGARGDARANEVALATLEGMAAGGVRDHVGGGFHRYSVDEHWTVPHFEKMLYDNAGLLGNYVHAFQATGDGTWREVAEGVLRFVLGDLAVAGGGFGGSQDADVGAGDDGDFFTWTEEEMRAALSEEECRIARLHFGLGGRGRMHHDPARNVLHVSADLDSLAEGLHASQHDVRVLLRTILEKLRNARAKRKTPYVDRTRYASWNGMMAVALLRSGAALDRPDADRGALAALDAFLAHAFDPERGVAHVLAEDGTASGWGLLDDQAQFADALVEAYGATGDEKYRTAAVALGRLLADGFYDGTAFRDRIAPGDGEGLLTSVDHPVGDSPTPSPNATAIRALRRLTDATDDPRFGNVARQAATALSGECGRLGIYGSALALALDELDDPPAAVKLVGTVEATAPLRAAARKVFAPGLTIRTVGSERGVPAPAAIVCFGDRCLGPVSDPAALRAALEGRA